MGYKNRVDGKKNYQKKNKVKGLKLENSQTNLTKIKNENK